MILTKKDLERIWFFIEENLPLYETNDEAHKEMRVLQDKIIRILAIERFK